MSCDRATADFIISSPLMDKEYDRIVPHYDSYRSRKIPGVTETKMRRAAELPVTAAATASGPTAS